MRPKKGRKGSVSSPLNMRREGLNVEPRIVPPSVAIVFSLRVRECDLSISAAAAANLRVDDSGVSSTISLR